MSEGTKCRRNRVISGNKKHNKDIEKERDREKGKYNY